MKIKLLASLLMVSLGGALSAQNCSVSTSGTAFGDYSASSNQPRDTSGTIVVICHGTERSQISYTIKLGLGGGTFSLRQMKSTNSSLSYGLYIDASRTQPWGDGTGGASYLSDSFSLINSSSTKSYTVYGRIPTGQSLSLTGAYADSLTVTLTYSAGGGQN